MEQLEFTFKTTSVWDIETLLASLRWYYKKCANRSERVFLKRMFKDVYDQAISNKEYKEYIDADEHTYANGDIVKSQIWLSAFS